MLIRNSKTADSVSNSPLSFSQQLHQLYKELAQLLIAYQQQKITTSLIKSTFAFSDSFILLGREYPDQLIGQLHFNKPSLPYGLNLVFNQLIFTYLLAQRESWNETAQQQLLCCVITQFAGNIQLGKKTKEDDDEQAGKTLTKLRKHNTLLLKALKKLSFEIWFEGLYKAEQRWHPNPLAVLKRCRQQSALLSLLSIATCWGFLFTRKTQKSNHSYAITLQRVMQQLPVSEYKKIDTLFEYPGLYPPGAIVKLNDGQYFLVLSLLKDSLIGKYFNTQTANCSQEIEKVAESQIVQVLGAQNLKHLNLLDEWWDNNWREFCEQHENSQHRVISHPSFRLDRPPPTLLTIQAHIQNDNFEVNELTQLIAEEPVFANHIKSMATQYSRENLKISDVKHALLMHGLDRANAVLMEHALNVRLNQHYFPLQEALLQYCATLKQVVAIIAEESKAFPSEQAICWAGFATSGLFTTGTLKSQYSAPDALSSGFKISELYPIEQAEQLPSHAIKLAECWIQERSLIQALRLLEQPNPFANIKGAKKPYKIAALLGTGIIICKHIYSQQKDLNDEEQSFFKQAFLLLGIKEFDIEKITQLSIEKQNPYSILR